MTLFYDPRKRKAKPWVTASFILVPVLLVLLILIVGRQYLSQHPADESAAQEEDIFAGH